MTSDDPMFSRMNQESGSSQEYNTLYPAKDLLIYQKYYAVGAVSEIDDLRTDEPDKLAIALLNEMSYEGLTETLEHDHDFLQPDRCLSWNLIEINIKDC